jgi:hypothetical protein
VNEESKEILWEAGRRRMKGRKRRQRSPTFYSYLHSASPILLYLYQKYKRRNTYSMPEFVGYTGNENIRANVKHYLNKLKK